MVYNYTIFWINICFFNYADMLLRYLQTHNQINATKTPQKMGSNNASIVCAQKTYQLHWKNNNTRLNRRRYAQEMAKIRNRAIINAKVGFTLKE